MNKLYILLFLLSVISISANQPSELGIFFENIKNTNLAKNQEILQKDVAKKIHIMNKDSNVFGVNNIKQFLYFTSKQALPLIINFYSENDLNKSDFQDIADFYKDKFVFLSINSSTNKQLKDLILKFLRYDGFSLLPNKIANPLILFCKPNSIIINNGILYLKKGGLTNIIKPGFFDKKAIVDKIPLFIK